MQLIRVKDAAAGGQVAFDIFKDKLLQGAKTFGLATGSTPLELYKRLCASDLDFSQAISINLDEYVGLSKNDEQSYHYFMQRHLFDKKPFKTSYLPDGQADDLEQAVKDYDRLIAEHPIDLQILGIGRNGHIGFNEPGTSFDSKTHIVNLEPSTIQANSRFFAKMEDVPKQAISMGIASIMSVRSILLMAYGSEKADAVAKMLHGPITEAMPASILQNHPNVFVIIDQAAGSGC